MNNIKESLQKKLSALQVIVDVEYDDNVYYLTLDGSKTYADNETWNKNWPNGIAGFGKSFFDLEKISIKEIVAHSPGIVKYKIGSLFDMLS